jgi:hypothetical protein
MIDALPLQDFTALLLAAKDDDRNRITEMMHAFLLAQTSPEERKRALAAWDREE